MKRASKINRKYDKNLYIFYSKTTTNQNTNVMKKNEEKEIYIKIIFIESNKSNYFVKEKTFVFRPWLKRHKLANI